MRERKLLVPIFMVLLLISTGVLSSCPIELSPPRVVMKYGDPVSVNCSTPGLKGIGWEAPQGGTGLEQVSTLLWTVDSLTEWDNEPMCFYNSDDYHCYKRPEIVLYTFPETISISSSSESYDMLRERQQYNFTCHIHKIAPVRNLTITWYKGDAIIQTETLNRDDKKPTNQSSVFSFTPTKEDNNATFRCGAYMDLGPEGPQLNVSSPEYRIKVLYGPVFICPSTYTIQEYSRQNLICSQGFPEPREIWYKDDEEVELPEILTRREAGQYWVMASNVLSVVNFTVDIIVLYPPLEIYELEDATVKAGASAGLKCSSVSFPRPKYSWSYHQVSNVIETTEDGVSHLRIENATEYNTGHYTCHAWNEVGNVSKTVRVTVTGVLSSCPIELSPPRVVVKYGDPVSVNCSTPGLKGIGWEAPQGGTGLEQVSTLLWTVDSLTEWDNEPMCFYNSGDYHCYKRPEIVLYTFPETISISSSSESYDMLRERQQYNFTCHIHKIAPVRNLTITWYKGDVVIQTETLNRDDKKPTNQSSVFSFTPTKEDNNATFSCGAYMDLGPEGPQLNVSSPEYRIKVLYGPVFICPSTYTIHEYSRLDLSGCSQGFPEPREIWYKDGVEVELPEILTRREAGQYWVTASNVLSVVNFTVEIIVLYPPSEIHELEDAEVNRGAPITLKCSSAGVPGPKYSWSYYKVANVIETTRDGVSRLHIENATEYNMGSYTCHASNEIGNVSKTVRVTVKESKVFFRPADNWSVTLKDGGWDNVTLQCDIINVAPAQNLLVQWTWIKGTENGILDGSSKSCTLSAVRAPVNVSCAINVSLKGIRNGTEIRCEPQLDLRPTEPLNEKDFSATIIYEPRINTTLLQEKMPVIRGYTETLICKASGNPRPEIEWSFTSTLAKLENGTLIVSEAGLYNCTAKNAINSVVHTVKVVLKEDYLPLIAGFVAVTVVAISVVFLFIYSIYYKNTKMRRYSLKNPKLGNHNGNVAHNGWDTQFPMTKLS